eukprot:scaffold136794_cov17-Tisochrysis_lutea.AAC.2
MQLLDAQRLEAWFALASPLPPGQAPPDKVVCKHVSRDPWRFNSYPRVSVLCGLACKSLATLYSCLMSFQLLKFACIYPGQLASTANRLLSAVFEGLVHDSVMEDAGVCDALVLALKTLQATIDLQPPAEGGRQVGLVLRHACYVQAARQGKRLQISYA